MRCSRESKSRVLRAGLLALASFASAGCYAATHDDGHEPSSPDEPANEGSSSSVPPGQGAPPAVGGMDAPPAEPSEPPPSEPAGEPRTVKVQPEAGFVLMQSGRIVGDLDGDGLDDLMLFGLVQDIPTLLTPPATSAYVFYGRADLPEALDAGAADAVLRGVGFVVTRPQGPGASGDLNGDGMTDVVIGGANEVYFLFGSEQRLRGEHRITDVAVTWTLAPSGMLPAFEAVRVASAGDVQGDGLFDVALSLTTGEHVTQIGDGFGASPIDSAFVIAGRQEAWPSGMFEAAWAETAFVVDGAVAGGCSMFGAADLNGDGFSDLMLQAEAERRLVLGGSDAPRGEVDALEAGEALQLPVNWLRALPDLDGDGSEEIAWADFSGNRVNLTFGAADLDPAELTAPDVVIRAHGMASPATTAADLDGDGALELIMVAGGAAEPVLGVYRVPGEGLAGQSEVGLEDAQRVVSLRGDDPTTNAPLALGLDAGGDLNGDGLVDLVVTTTSPDPPPRGSLEVTLLLSRR